MKSTQLFASLLALVLMAATPAVARDRFLLVKVDAWDGSVSYVVMSPEAFKAAEAEIALESRLSAKAMAQAQKEWRNDEALGNKAFPRAACGPGKVRTMKEYEDKSDADAKASDLSAKDMAKAAEERTLETNRKKGQSKEQNARDAARDSEKEALLTKARALYEAQLQALKTAQGAKD